MATLISVIKECEEANLVEDLVLKKYACGKAGGSMIDLRAELERNAAMHQSEPRRPKNVDFRSILCFVYTSGTTGMPKAALMKHFRCVGGDRSRLNSYP